MTKIEEIREIGIEKECFLMKGDKILEPRLYGFPKDEFEFLVELRSMPADRFYQVYTTLHQEEIQNSLRANKFGMELVSRDHVIVPREFVDSLWKKYDLYKFNNSDQTHNIYGNRDQSHHLGVLDTNDSKKKRLTAGIHVHFSSRNPSTGDVIDLPIEKIVELMDNSFSDVIKISQRNAGEWEQKDHGFEYRSIPGNADIYKVLKKSFEILRSV